MRAETTHARLTPQLLTAPQDLKARLPPAHLIVNQFEAHRLSPQAHRPRGPRMSGRPAGDLAQDDGPLHRSESGDAVLYERLVIASARRRATARARAGIRRAPAGRSGRAPRFAPAGLGNRCSCRDAVRPGGRASPFTEAHAAVVLLYRAATRRDLAERNSAPPSGKTGRSPRSSQTGGACCERWLPA